MNDEAKLLVIYLQDHDAAAQAGEALARRCAASNEHTALGTYLRDRFIPEVDADRSTLMSVLDAVDAAPSRAKRVVATAGQQAGRLKPNGRLRTYSPLSRVIELEALIAGVTAKKQLWSTVETVAATDADATLPDVSANKQRVDEQLEQLKRHHTNAVTVAFTPDAERVRP